MKSAKQKMESPPRPTAIACPPEPLTLVEAKIGIDPKDALFIRGQGEGLSWDKGLPLSRIFDRTWIWKSQTAKSKVIFKLLLNDQIWAKGGGGVVDAGRMVQVFPTF